MRLKNIYISFIVFILLFLLSGIVSASDERVCFDKACVAVELAQKPNELVKGMQHRKSLKKNKGMLFVFPEAQIHRFWMKNTLIPLDIIWLDESYHVVHIERDVPPCLEDTCRVYTPVKEALYVLEVNAGYTKKHGVDVGYQATFKLN